MKFSKSTFLGTLAAAATALAMSGFAVAGEEETTEQMDKPAFEELDANIDGVISEQEARDTWLAAEFDVVDQDKNGQVSRSEYEEAAS